MKKMEDGQILFDVLDGQKADELRLIVDNVEPLYRQKLSIQDNLRRKYIKNKYSSDRAPKLWMYLVTESARYLLKQEGGQMRNSYPKAFREWVAAKWAIQYEQEHLINVKLHKVKGAA